MSGRGEFLVRRLLREFARPVTGDPSRRRLVESLTRGGHLFPEARVLALLAPPEFLAELARTGASVTAVEPLEPLWEHGRQQVATTGTVVHWVRRDPSRLSFRRAFDVVIGIGLFLGTTGSESDDQGLLRTLAEALRPGGSLVLDLPNRELLIREFVERFWADLDDLRVLVQQAWDLPAGIVRVDWHLVWPHGHWEHHQATVRLYTASELATRSREAGFVEARWWGDDDASPYQLWSPRMLFVGRVAGDGEEPLAVGGE